VERSGTLQKRAYVTVVHEHEIPCLLQGAHNIRVTIDWKSLREGSKYRGPGIPRVFRLHEQLRSGAISVQQITQSSPDLKLFCKRDQEYLLNLFLQTDNSN
jgi:hypothetical protein